MSEMNGVSMCCSVSSSFLQEVTMSSATGVREPGDWFTAEADVPADVAVLNFVFQYYEHFDNNYGLDYKAAVQFDSHGRCDTARCLPAGLLTHITGLQPVKILPALMILRATAWVSQTLMDFPRHVGMAELSIQKL